MKHWHVVITEHGTGITWRVNVQARDLPHAVILAQRDIRRRKGYGFKGKLVHAKQTEK